MLDLMKKRVYNIAGCNSELKGVFIIHFLTNQVFYNDTQIKLKTFADYAKLFLKDNQKALVKPIVEKKNKGAEMKPSFINNMLINNPEFDSQTKETLRSKVTNFGTRCSVKSKLPRMD